MGSVRQLLEKRATLVEAEEDDNDGDDDDDDEDHNSYESCSSCSSSQEPSVRTFDVPYFRYIDDDEEEREEERGKEGEEGRGRVWSYGSGSARLAEEDYLTDSSDSSSVSDRYVVVSGTPQKILEHLLSDMRLDEQQGATENREAGERPFTLYSLSLK